MNHPTLSRKVSSNRMANLLMGSCVVGAIAVVVSLALSRSNVADTKEATTNAAARNTAATQPLPPVRQLELVHAERFQVDRAFAHVWRADKPMVTSGWLLVLAGKIDPPRQTLEPVLYVGAETAERINSGHESGRLVVLVPGDFALADAPIFYGAEALPEELRQSQIDAQLADAISAGATRPSAEVIGKVAAAAGRTFATDFELRLRAIELVEQYSPIEKELIAGWRAPLVK